MLACLFTILSFFSPLPETLLHSLTSGPGRTERGAEKNDGFLVAGSLGSDGRDVARQIFSTPLSKWKKGCVASDITDYSDKNNKLINKLLLGMFVLNKRYTNLK